MSVPEYCPRVTSATTLLGLDETRLGGLRTFRGGRGRPVLLLHGLGGAATNFVELVEGLTARHEVLAPDLPGHGGSPAPAHGASVDDFADVAAAVLDEAGAAAAIVVGHSFGGLVALRLAIRRPELVRGLLLVAPAGIRTRTRVVQWVVAAAGALRPGRAVAPFRRRWATRVWYRRAVFRPWFVSDPVRLSSRAAAGFLDEIPLHSDTRTAGRAMVADDPRGDLERVRCPALVLWGARDAQLPLDDAFEYARRLRAPLRVVADCGHLVIGERPEAVLDGVRHLDELPVEREAAGEARG